MNTAPSLAIGIDVGGTKTLAELIDTTTGDAVRSRRVATDARRGGAAVLDRCVELAAELGAGLDAVPAVGVALCEMVDPEGVPTSAVTVDWLGLDLAAAFDAFERVVVESDVRAAAIAEGCLGAGRGIEQFVYLTIGTGISFTSMLAGAPHRGVHGGAILLGIPPVERVASGPAIAARSGAANAEQAFLDPASSDVIAEAARQLGTAMAWLNNALDPELFVVGGGLGMRGDYLAAAVEAMRAAVDDAGGIAAPVRQASLGERSAVIGAALAAMTTG